ncbi:MAG: arginine deiminase family protein [Allosphingosinicella sp.]
MSVFAFARAIVRAPPRSVVDGLRTGAQAPTYEGVLAEFEAYVAALEMAGLAVDRLDPLEPYPDSLFVEDPAFVVPEGAILLRPGAPSRIGEAAEIALALERLFPRLLTLDRGHADGGDILILPDEILIGLSGRTDRAGAVRFCELTGELGRQARIVETPPGILHLKTACALVDEQAVIAVPALASLFAGFEVIETPPGEEKAANLLRLNDTILLGADYPRTAERLAGRAAKLVPVSVADIRKIDAGLSCLSLRW